MGKATIFVPSPNVAEDHQTHNAMALVRREAAMLVRDADAVDELLSTAVGLLHNDARRQTLEKNALAMALTHAAQDICDEVYKLV
jgi:UDP-N-acetylglucosamine--N-acetylmuramyl-(pentapeptide) pyrophosphoryl-undecaprenol N-acetylglucosamine transferase